MEQQQFIGKACKFDIYNRAGSLLLPRLTKITELHLKKLKNHNITLDPSDIIKYKQQNRYKVVDDSIPQVKKVFDEVRQTMKLSLTDLQKTVLPVISEITDGPQLTNLFLTLQAKDDYTYRHNIAVGAISSLIGQWLQLSEKDVLQLSTAGLLHDVGKMRIPESILNKPSRLTKQEFELMKKHTVFGYEIIKDTPGTNERQAIVALQHHERMDGSGYPFGLHEEKIDLFSRIVSVADVFHAMTSQRVYRDPSPFYEVLQQMSNDTFGVLDPKITKIFIRKIMESLIGNTVLMTDGREGTIIMIHNHDPTHPIVEIGNDYFDLSERTGLHIKKVVS